MTVVANDMPREPTARRLWGGAAAAESAEATVYRPAMFLRVYAIQTARCDAATPGAAPIMQSFRPMVYAAILPVVIMFE